MKKIFLLSLVFALMTFFCNTAKAIEDAEGSKIVQDAITKYKNKNYLGCISDLRLYTEKDPANAVAWYYLANAYMNIAMKEQAHAAFEKVIGLNTVPKLTSYSIQAEICMENSDKCKYQDFTNDQIKQLKANPAEFLNQYFASLNNTSKDQDTIEIENLINGSYSIHPSAKKFIDEERIKMKYNQSGGNRAYLPSNDNLILAYNMLKDSNNNNEISGFAMMIDSPEKIQNNDFSDVIRKYHEAGSSENSVISPETVQLMMMQNMISNF